jgi:mRNA interferase RelE/StbE
LKAFLWKPAARAELRRLDRETAMRILLAITRYGSTGEGDVRTLTDRDGLYRLRVGKWRIVFDLDIPIQFRFTPSITVAKRTDRPQKAHGYLFAGEARG